MIFIRLWHIDIIPYLPRSQLIAQWRELNSIFKKQDKHILINYIYNYDDAFLFVYTQQVMFEMNFRGIKIHSYENYNEYFKNVSLLSIPDFPNLRYTEHNMDYLTICYYNLMEKYLRGQKDFTDDVMWKLNEFYNERRNK